MSRASWVAGLVVTMVLGVVSTATACLWGYDTLLAERRRFPMPWS